MELFQVLEQNNYDIFYFEDFDINAEVVKINKKEEMTGWKKTINVYAIPKK